MGVLNDPEIHILQSPESCFGSVDVGLSDVEVVNLYSPSFCLLGKWYELADR
jgi:hypothetical protein